MIEIKDITVHAKSFALRDVSLSVQTGSCHIVIGPTGCGKTTLLEAVLGLRDVQKGEIIVDGRDVTNLPVHKRGFSYVPQDLAIFPHLTVEDNILYGIRHGKRSRFAELKFAHELAESLDITHLLKRDTRDLSGGERQRVALTRALASGNKYLLLDEPLSALHEGMKKELWFLIKELQKKYDFTILMVSHDMEETFFLSDYVSVMIDGVIHLTDRKETVYRDPKNLEVARFFGVKNIIRAEIRDIRDEGCRLFCDELNTEILLPSGRAEKNYQAGMRLTIGIRAEDVIILRPDLPMKKDNLLQGTVIEIYPMGSNSTVIFKPHNSDRVIEIVMPNFALAKLNLKSSIPVTVSLRGERLFVLR
ncbi:MAG: ABC transporter ATP-binding protein [Thermodesulfovibrionia bacterium]